jgi:hypothetical protein
MEKLRAALAHIRNRGAVTASIMIDLSGEWLAPEFVSPNNFDNMVDAVTDQYLDLVDKESLTNIAAGEWDAVLNPWHDASVLALQMARGSFKNNPAKLSAWDGLSAGGYSRELITSEGIAIEKAWKNTGTTWLPKTGITYAYFSAFSGNAQTKYDLHVEAERAESKARGLLNDMANTLYGLSIQWYEMATAAYGEDTPQGSLIRTIPTLYNPDEAPGRAQFTEHFSPAPNQVRLGWGAPRGHFFNLWAKAPGAPAFVKIFNHQALTTWMGEGLAAGEWKFQVEAENSAGLGEMSPEVIIAVPAAMAA